MATHRSVTNRCGPRGSSSGYKKGGETSNSLEPWERGSPNINSVKTGGDVHSGNHVEDTPSPNEINIYIYIYICICMT